MYRLFVVAALLAPNGACVATSAMHERLVAPAEPPPVFGSWVMAVAHVAASFELPVPHDAIDRLVRIQLGVRDLLHGMTDRLIALADRMPAAIPDLTILTTQPIADSLSSGYGWRDDPIRHTWKFHGGTDFPADPGTPVAVAGDGVVVFAGRQGGYGNVIYVDHGGGVVTLYGHLRRLLVKKDAMVAAGERIGLVGQTGRATGPHLHFEVRLDGRPVDPVTAMTVAETERTSPVEGRLAAFALAPEVQSKARAFSDRHSPRPERQGRSKRTQALW